MHSVKNTFVLFSTLPSTSKGLGSDSNLPSTSKGLQSNKFSEMIPIWPWKGLTLDMVQPPGVVLPNFDKKIHPSWESAHGTQQFVLPSGHSIAFWNNIPPTLFFYNRGYFRRNKWIPSEFKFCFDPDFDPYPDCKPGIIEYEPP